MSKTDSHTPTTLRRRRRPILQADLCRISGAAKSTVNKAFHGHLSPAVGPDGHVDANDSLVLKFIAKHVAPADFAVYPEVFCEMCACDERVVLDAIRGELRTAFDAAAGTIRVTHPAALAFLAKFPFDLDSDLNPINIPLILQTSAREDATWTMEHPLDQVFGARLDAALELHRKSNKSNA